MLQDWNISLSSLKDFNSSSKKEFHSDLKTLTLKHRPPLLLIGFCMLAVIFHILTMTFMFSWQSVVLSRSDPLKNDINLSESFLSAKKNREKSSKLDQFSSIDKSSSFIDLTTQTTMCYPFPFSLPSKTEQVSPQSFSCQYRNRKYILGSETHESVLQYVNAITGDIGEVRLAFVKNRMDAFQVCIRLREEINRFQNHQFSIQNNNIENINLNDNNNNNNNKNIHNENHLINNNNKNNIQSKYLFYLSFKPDQCYPKENAVALTILAAVIITIIALLSSYNYSRIIFDFRKQIMICEQRKFFRKKFNENYNNNYDNIPQLQEGQSEGEELNYSNGFLSRWKNNFLSWRFFSKQRIEIPLSDIQEFRIVSRKVFRNWNRFFSSCRFCSSCCYYGSNHNNHNNHNFDEDSIERNRSFGYFEYALALVLSSDWHLNEPNDHGREEKRGSGGAYRCVPPVSFMTMNHRKKNESNSILNNFNRKENNIENYQELNEEMNEEEEEEEEEYLTNEDDPMLFRNSWNQNSTLNPIIEYFGNEFETNTFVLQNIWEGNGAYIQMIASTVNDYLAWNRV